MGQNFREYNLCSKLIIVRDKFDREWDKISWKMIYVVYLISFGTNLIGTGAKFHGPCSMLDNVGDKFDRDWWGKISWNIYAQAIIVILRSRLAEN